MTDQIKESPVDSRQIVYMSPYPGMGGQGQDDEINLLAIWDVVWKKKFFIASLTLLLTLVAVYVTLYVLPETYQSEAVLLQSGSGDSKMGGLASLASSLPIPLALPRGSTGDQLMVFLQSQTLQMKLIEKYDLLPRLYKDKWDPVKKVWLVDNPSEKPTVVSAIQKAAMKDKFTVTQDDLTQLITITWVDEEPAFAADMLQRVVEELDYYLVHEYISNAKRERQFVEKQLKAATTELEHWEQQVPTDELTLAKIKREILATTTVYTELRKQVELARLTEAKEVINFKVIDHPYIPEVRFKPKRTLICAATLVLGLFLSVVIVLFTKLVTTVRKQGAKE
jgi:uncharacterized protein involved in exopolysaccharide biosynthesis